MLNNKLLEEILKTLYTDGSGNIVLLNPMLKAGGYKQGEIASTMQYMVDEGMIGGSMHLFLNKTSAETRQRNTLDDIEIKTRISPKGATYYRENFERVAPISYTVNAPNAQITNTTIGAATNSPVHISPTQTPQEQVKPDKLGKYASIVTIISGIVALLTWCAAKIFPDFEFWLDQLFNS
jgi:hypothetical protein